MVHYQWALHGDQVKKNVTKLNFDMHLNAGMGDAWAGQSMVRAWFSDAVKNSNLSFELTLGIALPMGSEILRVFFPFQIKITKAVLISA